MNLNTKFPVTKVIHNKASALRLLLVFTVVSLPRGSSLQKDKKMLTRPRPPLSNEAQCNPPHSGRIQSPLTSCGISCRRMAIVVRNPTCSREKQIRKQFQYSWMNLIRSHTLTGIQLEQQIPHQCRADWEFIILTVMVVQLRGMDHHSPSSVLKTKAKMQ